MAKEIERKFLVEFDKLPDLKNGVEIKQGYLSTMKNAAVRVRLKGERAYLTIKGEITGITCSEFEYEIPTSDADQIISEMCGEIINKTRYEIPYQGHIWELDIFHESNSGLVIVEIELQSENETFKPPTWLGKEVTGQSKYYNSNLSKQPFTHWKDI